MASGMESGCGFLRRVIGPGIALALIRGLELDPVLVTFLIRTVYPMAVNGLALSGLDGTDLSEDSLMGLLSGRLMGHSF